jgi:uncharacterized protein (DUF1684 family)
MTEESEHPVSYEEEALQWRQKVEASLRGEESWLSLAGLFWLASGENPIGSGRGSAILLPEGTAPEAAGVIEFNGTQALFHAAPGVAALVGEERVETILLQPDVSGLPTRVRLGDVTFLVVRRGNRWGVRVWNRNHTARTTFPGRRWYPIDEGYVVSARYVRYDPPRPVMLANVLGDSELTPCPGHVEFEVKGASARLLVTEADDEGLFLIFADTTSGKTTYPPGRFLATGPAAGEQATLDFNRAYSPPCAFSPYATCPLPPAENHLQIAIEAGEQHNPHWPGG